MTSYVSSPSPAQPRLDQPYYGIGFLPAVRRGFQKYAAFTGRASRSEFWWWQLFLLIGYVVLGGLSLVVGLATSPNRGRDPGAAAWPFIALLMVFLLGVVVPTIAVSVRRLHDSGNCGWLFLLVLIPYVGSLVVLVFGLLGSSLDGVRYERDPANAVLPPGVLTSPGSTSYAGQRPPYQYGQADPYQPPTQSHPTWQPPVSQTGSTDQQVQHPPPQDRP